MNAPTIKQKRSGDDVLHFANCLPDLNFPFSTFNFKKITVAKSALQRRNR